MSCFKCGKFPCVCVTTPKPNELVAALRKLWDAQCPQDSTLNQRACSHCMATYVRDHIEQATDESVSAALEIQEVRFRRDRERAVAEARLAEADWWKGRTITYGMKAEHNVLAQEEAGRLRALAEKAQR